MVDYRKLRLSNLTSPEFSHLLWALYWPVYGLSFFTLELIRPASACHPVWCPLDDLIPFNEWFLIPYLFWFVFLVGMVAYLLLYDPQAFRRFMLFIILTFSAAILCYAVYPTRQDLRPVEFSRSNFLTYIMGLFYNFDTNTNVCPSLHAIGSLAVAFAAWDTKRFQTPLWRVAFLAVALLISVSTVFVKQHSAVDVLAAFAVSAVGYVIVYVVQPVKRKLPSGVSQG